MTLSMGQFIYRLAASTLLIALLLFHGGCGDSTAVDITFEPDPNKTNVESLISNLRFLTLVLDSDEGLYPHMNGNSAEEMHLEDVDGDGQVEFKIEVQLPGDRLPLIRLERGGLPGETFEIRVEGFSHEDDENAIAAGGRDWIQFQAGVITKESVPFNLLSTYMAPKVDIIKPDNNARDVSPNINSVLVYFSKLMQQTSLSQEGVFVVVRVDSSGETLVPATQIEVETIPNSESEDISIATYHLTPPLDPGSYHVRISRGALDVSGRPLDHKPSQPGIQDFFSQFKVAGSQL